MDRNAPTNGQHPAQTGTPALSDGEGIIQPVLIPDHQLLRCIGRGSYGQVWLAQNTMGMYRAVKIVYRKSFQNERPFERELSGIRRFEPISRSHEGFVDVLHVGINEEEEYFYYVMELGDDQAAGQNIDPDSYSPKTLGKEISLRGKLSLQECLELGMALSQALAELHKRGLVHRDVKPSNIIFVNGVPKLADIGLVAAVDETRSYVGTEGFIPPEGPGTPQADVYSLGKVLYEASTGKDRQNFPELPTQLESLPDSEGFLELNEVLLHACKNDISDRYKSAWNMHADLLVLANGKSVKRLKLLERRLSSLKRIVSISAIVLIIIAAISYNVYREWSVGTESRLRQVGANVAYGNSAMESGDLLGALPHFADALQLDQGNVNRQATHRLRLGSVFAQCPKLTHLWFAGTNIMDGEFSPDGKKVLITGSSDRAKIYDIETGEIKFHPFGERAGLSSGVFSANGQFIATANEENSASIWNATTLEEIRHLAHPAPVSSARFSPDGLQIITACDDGIARVWEVQSQSGQPKLLLKQHTDAILFAAYSPDGRLIITASKDSTAQIWDATNGQAKGEPLAHGSWVTYAAFSPDNRKIITTCFDRKARVWEVENGRSILPNLYHGDGVQSGEFSPDGLLIVTTSLDGMARLWRADTLQPVEHNPILRHGERVTHASFSPDGRCILATCIDGSVRVWDLAGSIVPPIPTRNVFSDNGSRFLTITNTSMEICDAASGRVDSKLTVTEGSKAEFSRNGKFILISSVISSNSQGTNLLLQVWDATTGKPMEAGLSFSNSFPKAALSDDGKRLITFNGKVAQTWDLVKRTPLSPPIQHSEIINSAFFSPNGNQVVTGCSNEVQVWNAFTGQPTFPLLKHSLPVEYTAFSPDGAYLVTCCSDYLLTKCFAQVWNASTGQPIGPQLKHGDGVLFASFSPDSRRVVTASEDFTAIVWDAVTGAQLAALKHDNQVVTAIFSPNGKQVVTASRDKTARVWSAETGDPLTPPLRHNDALANAKFLADGRRIVTSDQPGNVRVWNLPVKETQVDDLRNLAHLLSNDPVTPQGRFTSSKTESIKISWQQLRTKYPDDFKTTGQEIAAWHEFEAESSEIEKHWFAAAFHLKQLLSMRPGDQSLLERLNRVNKHWDKKN
ncbi:MAG: repeat-containing protein [Pedosphaera sp.]|nr:repeat-containing protein [Pedosphaera sp.]